jgi:hypothetical protein
MKAKKFVLASMLVVLLGLVGGCHYGSDNDHRAWGYGNSSYRDGFRDGRSYQRRRDTGTAWGYSPYYERYGYYRR